MSTPSSPMTAAAPDEMEILIRRVERERRARKQAEQLLEHKSMELYEANQRLQAHAAELERIVHERTPGFGACDRRDGRGACVPRANSSPW